MECAANTEARRAGGGLGREGSSGAQGPVAGLTVATGRGVSGAADLN